MEWVERLNRSLEFIEEHLTDEIDYEQLGRIACCSAYHYQRMFTYMAGITLAEYIRRRKMSLAAVDLQSGSEKIIDIALKYGYNSPTAFNRAFQSFHGIPPSAVKNEGAEIKAFSPIVFSIAVKGASEMNYRIEKKEPFRIVGISMPLDKNIENNFASVCSLPRKTQKIDTQNAKIPLKLPIKGKTKGIFTVKQNVKDNAFYRFR